MARRLPAYRPGLKMVNISGKALQWIGFVLVCLSSLSLAVLQRGVLKLGDEGSLEILNEAMKSDSQTMGWVTGAVMCSMASMLAIPIFAKLVYEGWKHSESRRKLLLGLAICAVVSEIPYDFAMNGKLLDMSAQNPVWALLLAAVVLEITQSWKMKSAAADCAFRAVIVIAALAWSLLLRIYMGYVLILLPALFCFAAKWKWVTMLGGVLLTLLQFPAPLGMIFVHWYDGKKEQAGGKLLYILYPVQLLVFGVIAMLLT